MYSYNKKKGKRKKGWFYTKPLCSLECKIWNTKQEQSICFNSTSLILMQNHKIECVLKKIIVFFKTHSILWYRRGMWYRRGSFSVVAAKRIPKQGYFLFILLFCYVDCNSIIFTYVRWLACFFCYEWILLGVFLYHTATALVLCT